MVLSRHSRNNTAVFVTLLCLSLVSNGLGGSERSTARQAAERAQSHVTNSNATQRPSNLEPFPGRSNPSTQRAAQVKELAARDWSKPSDTAGGAQQSLTAHEGSSVWSGICTWSAWVWRLLARRQGQPTYRWQESDEEEGGVEEMEWDDRGTGRRAQKRRLKEITIPHIIHQVFLDGEAALEEEERKEERAGREFRRFNHRWRNSCQKMHPGWQHMFWDNQAAEELLLERYPWFLDTWRSYPRVVHRGDAIRPFLLHAYGGLYMDVDVECFDATDKMIDGFDLVLQLEDSGNKSLNNAVMAGAPGLQIWSIMHDLLQQRAPHLVAMHNKTRSQRDMSHAVLYATGPWLLRDAFKEFSGEAGDLAAGYAGEHTVKGTHVMVYALGQWFEPCEWSDLSCHALVDIAAVSGTPLRGIVGHHKNAGTWLKGYGDDAPQPLSLRLRLRLRPDTWATLAMGAALLVAMGAAICMRLFRRRRRTRNSSTNNLAGGGHRRVTSLNSFGSLASLTGTTELVGLERRAMSYGSRLSSLGSSYGSKGKLARPASQQKFSILSEIEKGEL